MFRITYRKHRINNLIKSSEVRLIDENGKQIGIVPISQALQLSQERGLDLVEVSTDAKPPVCRIINYGKFLYQQEKKIKEQKSKQKGGKVKGIRISLKIGKHDLEFKAKKAKEFLEKGNKVKIEIILKGREKAFRNLAEKKMEEFRKLIPTETTIELPPKKEQRGLMMLISKTK